jgi:hypothetical protein
MSLKKDNSLEEEQQKCKNLKFYLMKKKDMININNMRAISNNRTLVDLKMNKKMSLNHNKSNKSNRKKSIMRMMKMSHKNSHLTLMSMKKVINIRQKGMHSG